MKARQARRTEFEGIAVQARQAYAKADRDTLAGLLGRHIVANLGKFHAKQSSVSIIRDETGKAYAFTAKRRTSEEKQSGLACQHWQGIIRLPGITKQAFDLLQLSRYGFKWDNSQYRHGKANKIRTIGCIAKLGDIDRQRLRFNANLACLLELLP